MSSASEKWTQNKNKKIEKDSVGTPKKLSVPFRSLFQKAFWMFYWKVTETEVISDTNGKIVMCGRYCSLVIWVPNPQNLGFLTLDNKNSTLDRTTPSFQCGKKLPIRL